ncbi:molybdopterin converting factor, subunit 2, partial [Cooperia oncophora]
QRALLTARKNGSISFFDVTTDSDHPSEEFITSLIRSFFDDIVRISNNPLDVGEMMKLLTSPACGPTSMFAETTPDVCGGKKVLRHYYESDDEMAHKELRNICGRIRNKYPAVERVVIFHRVGAIPAGETSLLIATSSAYQEDALCATKMAFNEIRKVVSIRKKVIYEDDVNSSKGDNQKCNGRAHNDNMEDNRAARANG